jgi:hypothetical protein
VYVFHDNDLSICPASAGHFFVFQNCCYGRLSCRCRTWCRSSVCRSLNLISEHSERICRRASAANTSRKLSSRRIVRRRSSFASLGVALEDLIEGVTSCSPNAGRTYNLSYKFNSLCWRKN